jgi:multidrug resistance efflux pump
MKRRFRNLSYVLLGLVLLVGIGCQARATQQPTLTPPAASAYTQPKSVGTDRITALGTVRPAQRLQLSFAAAGALQNVSVRLGTEVKAGEVLAELDTAMLDLQLQSAQEEIAARQAALDALLNGSSEAAIERAEAEHAQQVAQAKAALHIAQLQLEQARHEGQTPTLDMAQLGLQQAALQVEQARAQPPTPEVTIAQVNLARAQDTLARAQDEYRKALDRPWEPQEIRDGLARAVQQAEWDAQLAKARLAAAQNAQLAHQLGLNALGVQSSIGEAQVAQAMDAQAAYTVTLALLASRVEQAQLTLEGLETWTNPLLDPVSQQGIAQAEARVRQAGLAAEQLALQIEGAVLRAPFDGVISAVYVRLGEWAVPGAPVVEILDTTHWYVETRNVSELTIGQVSVGQAATVQIIPFGNETLHGQVDTISPIAVVQQGDTTYTLMIALEPTDLNLRPGMNAQVEVQTK